MAKKKKKQRSRPSSPKHRMADLVQEAFRYSAAAFHSLVVVLGIYNP